MPGRSSFVTLRFFCHSFSSICIRFVLISLIGFGKIKSKSDESGSAIMKQLFSLLLVLSLAACAAGPQTAIGQTALATEETFSSPLQPRKHTSPETKPSLEAEHDPEARPPLETVPETELLPGTVQETEEMPATERVVDPCRPMVALTFDDGPHPEYTDQILDILEENNAVATFFEVAANLHKDPEAVRRAADMGCEIGSHSYRHANLGKMSQEAIQADLAAADEAFIQVLGQAPTLLRPPYGSSSKILKTTSERALVTWSIDPQDWFSKDAGKVVAHVKSYDDLDGQVILLHSIYGSTVEATRVLVPWLLEQGYQLVTVSELITLRFGDQVEPNRMYNYDYFRYQVPPLPKAADGEAAVELVAEEKSDGPVTVKLVLRESSSGETVSPDFLKYVFSNLRSSVA